MKNTAIFLWLMSCLLILLPPLAFTQDSDPGDTGYKPPPYYTPQTAQVAPTLTATMIAKPPISSYTSTLEPAMVQSYGSEISLNNSINAGVSNTSVYSSSSVPVNYTPVASSSAWVPKPLTTSAPQPAVNPENQETKD